MTATAVFVHGMCHGGWCWELTRERLREEGVPSVALDLPMKTLDGDAAILQKTLAELSAEAVVVIGHSWGGSVVTLGASRAPNVQHLIYICASLLDAGVSVRTKRRDTGPSPLVVLDDSLVIDPDRAREIFYNDVEDQLAQLAISKLRPFKREASRSVPVSVAPAWKSAPTTYVVCLRDRVIHPEDQRQMAMNATEILEWDTGHSPFLSRPDLVADLVLDRCRPR